MSVTIRPFVAAALLASLAGSASANVAIEWNNALLDAIRSSSMNPPAASRAMAMVSTAVFDAVNAVDPQYNAYRLQPAVAPGTSADAAAITAAHSVLSSIFTNPAQQAAFNTLRDNQLAGIADGPGKVAGINLGLECATDMTAWRVGDGSTANVPYTPGNNPGDWRPTPPGNAPALLPGWGNVTPFGINNGSQFRPAGPALLDSPEYAAQVRQVQIVGAADAEFADRDNNGMPDRTPEQTQIAQFWAQGAGTSTPPGQWNAITQEIVSSKNLSLLDTARTFALVNIATADAAIAAWDAKYEFSTWRPVAAIREAGTDGNPGTEPEANWSSLLVTPPFPSYTSGHSTFSAAAAAVLAALFGDDTAFTVDSDAMMVGTRSFNSFSEAAAEAGLSRIYGGIHFMDDNLDGLSSGRQVGLWAHRNYLRPIPEPGAAVLALSAGLTLVRRRRLS